MQRSTRLFLKGNTAILFATVPIMAFTSPSYAAPDPENQITSHDNSDSSASNYVETIIVTARKREERLQNVPVSVAVTSAERLETKSIEDMEDLGNFTPNFQVSGSAGRGKGGSAVFIRGVGQQQPDANLQPGVGIYVDGVYIASMQGMNIDLVDPDRIEVLYGPQGTLFGKNTIGGAVNIVSKKPTDEYSGTAAFTIGRFNRMDGSVSANVPIVRGTLDTRFALAVDTNDGYGRRINSAGQRIGRTGNTNRVSGRAQFLWTLSESMNALLSVDGQQVRQKAAPMQLAGLATTPPPLLVSLNAALAANNLPPFGSGFLSNDPYLTYASGLNNYNIDGWNTSLTLNWDLGDVSLKSITAYRNLKTNAANDFDNSPYKYVEQQDQWNQHQVSQEFQLNGNSLNDRLKWLLGAFYMKDSTVDLRDSYFAVPIFLAGGSNSSTHYVLDVQGKNFAVFGQATYALTDKLNLTFGGRYTRDKRRTSTSTIQLFTGTVSVPTGIGRASYGAATWLAGADYHIAPDFMTYVSAGKGFKGGIPKNIAANQIAEVLPEYVTSYEAGFKSEFLDHKIRLNTAVYLMNYTNQQLYIPGASPTGRVISFVSNAGKSRIQGAEVDLSVIPLKGLSLNAGLGITDAKYLKVGTAPIALDDKFVETPHTTVTLSAEYKLPVDGVGEFTANIDYAYKSSIERDTANNPLAHQRALGLLNAQLGLKLPGGRWSASLFGTNLTNEVYSLAALVSTQPAFGFGSLMIAPPREWGLRIKCSF